ncbi:Tyrosine-protein kinase [Parasponia andersonii]|uniref:Tyrosine-protein kinase n=1 Tax=Parasponia andersonii TaxID=3476 RepID=A0A2P5C0A7_PARAD|nr:Tyrosine-protein kinase [Parasponia andersonii]
MVTLLSPTITKRSSALKMTSLGSFRNESQSFRADRIDLKMLDIQLEKMNYSRSWSLESERCVRKEQWQIDLSKLDIRHIIAKGAYGIVYRAVYDGQDVAVLAVILPFTVKVLDWGEDGFATTALTAALRASFRQEVSVWHNLEHPNVTKISIQTLLLNVHLSVHRSFYGNFQAQNSFTNSLDDCRLSNPFSACCIVVEYLPGGTLKNYLYRNRRKKIAFKIVVQLALDLARGSNLRPEIPRWCPNSYAKTMKKCWNANPQKRPEMDDVVRLLEALDTSKGGGMIPEDQASGCFCFGTPRGP